jgi:hypothetical protein
LYHLALVAHGEGDHRWAAKLLHESLAQRQASRHRLGIIECLESIAVVAHAKEEPERAAQILAAAEAMRQALDAPHWAIDQTQHDRQVATLRAALGDGAFGTASASGRAMRLEEALELVVAPS